MDVQVKVSLNGVDEKLTKLGPTIARNTLRKALRVASKLIEDDAKARAPVDTGDLRDSIKTTVTTSAKKESATAIVGPTIDQSLIKNGRSTSQSPGVYGKFVELGTKSVHPQPFLRPAFDSKGEAAVEALIEEIWKGLEEAAK